MENLKNEFVVLFRELTDNELIERFNQNVGTVLGILQEDVMSKHYSTNYNTVILIAQP
ncbi:MULTISPECIES: hypothetical protein [Empedobacter]|uniref:Uncharacterized protein n=1 Tax=Empedobacter falsenii TaxID=343874 RepID=A0A376GJQ4_9FLAO|nr:MULTISPECIES: hypothetical protein [Empedobacter]MDH0660344.1 hypothetical protein [Empedobacter sp. GD03865]MDH0673989.1 hypothetical protein [Empedobacter sp. GD03861]STD59163.1 Uncharacterised protein [Empedobacter falsenii]